MASDSQLPDEIDPDEGVDVAFSDLGLHPKILKALDDIGYETPTPIQARAIPPALQNRDVLGIAQTGTGKTGAFTLPTVHKLATGRARARMPRCLIVCPTRELAAQVAENVELYGKYLKLEMALLIGGVSFGEQDRKLTRGVDILIATPGRLLDQFERGKILMTGVQTLVVDEADRMLDMGFIPDIERIFEMTPFTRQVLFFSATMPAEIKRLVDTFLHQPETIRVARKNMTADTVRERIVRMPSSDHKQKRNALRWLIDNLAETDEGRDNGIIFCNRKRDVDIVAKSLAKYGYKAAPIHGDLPQSTRTQTLEDFKSGEVKWLVASDVAARGLDVPDVSFVFNYDVPTHAEDYVHRIGRTGRAGRKGDAVMLVARLDGKYYDAILDMTKRDEIEEMELPGIEDFPTEGRSKRGSSESRGRGGSRGGGRSGRSRSAPKREAVEETAREVETKDAKPAKAKAGPPSRRKAPPSRRAAPPRKSSGEKEETPEAKDAPREEAPKRSRRPRGRADADETPKAKPKSESKPKPDGKPKAKPKSRGRSSAKPDTAKAAKAFGGDVPDFFKV